MMDFYTNLSNFQF